MRFILIRYVCSVKQYKIKIDNAIMNQLSKSSANTEIKAYFSEVLRLASNNKEFPVNLDECIR
ncbi:hypothetical protein EZS27_008835 [termite gut metagenome]|uniref:Uncharacterized protein n=1 Tax=termite gut metagenome TaxID=433724 RepID=A0A5J4SBD3_9ZZZZ